MTTTFEMPHASVIEMRDRCVFCGAPMSDLGPCPARKSWRLTAEKFDSDKSALDALREPADEELDA